jgi:hypothetical protein
LLRAAVIVLRREICIASFLLANSSNEQFHAPMQQSSPPESSVFLPAPSAAKLKSGPFSVFFNSFDSENLKYFETQQFIVILQGGYGHIWSGSCWKD